MYNKEQIKTSSYLYRIVIILLFSVSALIDQELNKKSWYSHNV